LHPEYLATGWQQLGSFQHPKIGSAATAAFDRSHLAGSAVNVRPMPRLEFEGRRITPLQQVPNPRTAEGYQATAYLALDATNAFIRN
jgi:hypothetical protein